MDIKKKLASTKEAVVRNQTKILATATVLATGAALLFRLGSKEKDDFLKEHGLYEEFYAMTDED